MSVKGSGNSGRDEGFWKQRERWSSAPANTGGKEDDDWKHRWSRRWWCRQWWCLVMMLAVFSVASQWWWRSNGETSILPSLSLSLSLSLSYFSTSLFCLSLCFFFLFFLLGFGFWKGWWVDDDGAGGFGSLGFWGGVLVSAGVRAIGRGSGKGSDGIGAFGG